MSHEKPAPLLARDSPPPPHPQVAQGVIGDEELTSHTAKAQGMTAETFLA